MKTIKRNYLLVPQCFFVFLIVRKHNFFLSFHLLLPPPPPNAHTHCSVNTIHSFPSLCHPFTDTLPYYTLSPLQLSSFVPSSFFLNPYTSYHHHDPPSPPRPTAQARDSHIVTVVFLNETFGNALLPRVIEGPDFDQGISSLEKDTDRELFWKWYHWDENAQPPCYKLQPISTFFPNIKVR